MMLFFVRETYWWTMLGVFPQHAFYQCFPVFASLKFKISSTHTCIERKVKTKKKIMCLWWCLTKTNEIPKRKQNFKWCNKCNV
jgi:hypothetical protein